MKSRLVLSMDEMKIRELKKKAIDADMDLSDFLAVAGTISDPKEIIKNKNKVSTAGAVKFSES